MSRSYRKPYSSVTGVLSAHQDKALAARAMRRRQNEWLRKTTDYEQAMIPHRYECTHNNVCGWVRDGRKRLCSPHSKHGNSESFYLRYWIRLQRK